ncbi:MAG: hypothetical protein LBR27_10745 [Bifidobacteriaceae bacterium]|jgi:hypothetical protein|nr:hypothetical protein [Bifidobacteriaceae bacterium]
MRKRLIPRVVAVLTGAGLAFGLGLAPVTTATTTEPAQAIAMCAKPTVSYSRVGPVLFAKLNNSNCYYAQAVKFRCWYSTTANSGTGLGPYTVTVPARSKLSPPVAANIAVARAIDFGCKSG